MKRRHVALVVATLLLSVWAYIAAAERLVRAAQVQEGYGR
jgi:hypothetical protein